MDPCPFVRLIVECLALKLPALSRPTGTGPANVHPSTNPCFCVLTLLDNSQTSPLPLASSDPTPPPLTPPVVFSLDHKASLRNNNNSSKPISLLVCVYSGRTGSTCGFSGSKQLGRVRLAVDVEAAGTRGIVMQSGWVSMGGSASGAWLHLVVRGEPDPRFVFEFGDEPECSPVVYQVQTGNISGGLVRQPVFSCRFSADRRRNTRSRSLPSESSRNSKIRGWLASIGPERDQFRRDQRKGWTVTIHDLSGSPAAAASMITPFVPSPGSDRVSRSNPGAWLILRATGSSTSNWKPWGRFEAWRERGPVDALGYKFELVTDNNGPNNWVLIAESSISVKKGGCFKIDPPNVVSGGDSTKRSWPFVGGFVMEATVEGEGKTSKPTVQVGVQHVTCTGDAALFVALAAAADLSMDACQLFSHKLRKELCCDQQEHI